MKKILILFLLALPAGCMAQMVGIGAQWSDFDKINFHATVGYPYKLIMGETITWSLGSRMDYVSGSPTVSGLNVKPLSFEITTTEFFIIKPVTISLGADAGFNKNFRHGDDGIVLTPSLYIDYNVFYMKAGYDYNTFSNNGNFFLRFGLAFGQGAVKRMAKKF